MSGAPGTMLRFGSFHGRLRSSRTEYIEALKLVFGVGIHPMTPEADLNRQFDLVIEDVPDPTGPNLRTTNLLKVSGTPTHRVIETAALTAELETGRTPMPIRMTVLRSDVPAEELLVHLVVMIHKLLFVLDRVVLHAAAVELNGEVSLFVGNKGAGKSTTTLALARAGGTVLAEDQVVLHRTAGGFRVSGGDGRSRLTERTEKHFFAEPLEVEPRDFAGTMKKEIAMGDYFRSRPYTDFPAHRLVFPSVTGSFGLTPLRAQPALLRLMGFNSHFQRFEGPRDQMSFLDFLGGFVAGVSCWELSLSDDLAELDRLPALLTSAPA